jgi:hypothetical protein
MNKNLFKSFIFFNIIKIYIGFNIDNNYNNNINNIDKNNSTSNNNIEIIFPENKNPPEIKFALNPIFNIGRIFNKFSSKIFFI